MNRQRKILVVLMALSVAMAGCLHTNLLGNDTSSDDDDEDVTSSITQTNGLTINFNSVTPEYEVSSGGGVSTSAQLEAEYENTGEAQADIVQASLFGASWVSGQNAGLSVGSPQTLDGIDRSANLPGDTYLETYTPTIDVNLDSGQDDQYNIGLRTIYGYDSETRATITLVDGEEFRDRQSARSMMRNNKQAGPVHFEFRGETPYPDDRGTINVPIRVTNVGPGDLVQESGGSWEAVPMVRDVNVTFESRSNDPIDADSCNRDSIQVFDGQRSFNCEINTTNLDANPELTLTMQVDGEYYYRVDRQTNVRAIGR